MPRFVLLFSFLCAGAGFASASTLLFQGTFLNDNQVELFSLTTLVDETVTIESYGYAGGTVGPVTIAAGGFAPNLMLFDPAGTEFATDQGGHSAITKKDPVTGNYDDPYIREDLAPGIYTLGLSVWDNQSSDGTLGDGFRQAGNPGFTCAEAGAAGEFCDVTTATGVVRTGGWGITIAGADSASDLSNPSGVPEPGTLPLALAAGVLIALTSRNRTWFGAHRAGTN